MHYMRHRRQAARATATALLIVAGLSNACAPTRAHIEPARDDGHSLRLNQARFGEHDRPRNIIFLMGDGMGFGHLSALSVLRGGNSAMEGMPVSGIVSTASADRLVTDSAAGASAYATGQRTRNRMLSLAGDGKTPLPTLLERMRTAGRSAGLVTTSYVIDASPAAWAAHHPDRYDYEPVARQMIASGTELLIGGRKNFPSRVLQEAADTGYHLTDLDREPLSSIRLPALALYQSAAHEIDNPELPLAELTRTAITLLARDSDGFFLFVEHEGTDEATHNGNIPGMLDSVRSLDDALAVALEFARRRSDTLVIVAADHETGGVQVLEDATHRELRIELPRTRHTGAMVPVLAYGPGAHHFTGVHTNEGVGRILASLVD